MEYFFGSQFSYCGKPMTGRQETLFCWFSFFGGALIVVGWGLRQKVSFRTSWNRIFLSLFFFFRKLVGLNPEARAKYLAIQPLLATSWLLATRASPIYLVDEFTCLLPVLLKEMRMLRESKVLSSLLLGLIKGMRRWGKSKILLCNPRGWKLLPRPSATGVV